MVIMMQIESTSELVLFIYKKTEENVAKFRKTINRPLTLSEKILIGHFEDINDTKNIEWKKLCISAP